MVTVGIECVEWVERLLVFADMDVPEATAGSIAPNAPIRELALEFPQPYFDLHFNHNNRLSIHLYTATSTSYHGLLDDKGIHHGWVSQHWIPC